MQPIAVRVYSERSFIRRRPLTPNVIQSSRSDHGKLMFPITGNGVVEP